MKKYIFLTILICAPMYAYMQALTGNSLRFMNYNSSTSYIDFKNYGNTNVGGFLYNNASPNNNPNYGDGDDVLLYSYGRDLNITTGISTAYVTFLGYTKVGIGRKPDGTSTLDVNGSIKWGSGSYISSLNVDQGASIELRGSGTPYIDFSGPGVQDYDIRLIRSGADLLSIEGGGLQIPYGALYINNGSLSISSGNLTLSSGNLQLSNGDIEFTSVNKKLIYAPNDLFTHNTNSVGHQSLGWYDDSWNTNGKTMYLSGWAGLKFFTNGTARLLIDNSGNVGIGINPGTTAKLTVDGKIECEEVEVKNIGADFVFEDDYKLMTIAEVEAFIKSNKHLPGVPPAIETEKGIGLAKMNEILLMKIEELQLYVIDLQRQVDELKK